MAHAAAIPREVAEAMMKLGVKELAPGGRAYRIAGKVIHLATSEGRKRALDTGTGVEVDPRTERPLGAREAAAGEKTGGMAIGAVRAMIEDAVQAVAGPLAKKIADLEKALEGKADKK